MPPASADSAPDRRPGVQPIRTADEPSLGRAAGHLIRPAQERDLPAILRLIRALAHYEREPDAVQTTEQDLGIALFAAQPQVFCLIAEQDGPEVGVSPAQDRVIGFALWFVTFSTWRGRHGIWLEDLFVDPAHRRGGVGRDLLRALAEICVQRGYARLEWTVLDWNTPARDFYAAIGAGSLDEWTTHRLDGPALTRLAAGELR